MFMFPACPTIVVVGTEWVAVARHGLILWENEAMGSNIILK